MRNAKLDHTLATLEQAADHAHLAPFEKAEVSQKTKAAIASALNHCVEAASDLERFLGHAAVATVAQDLHHALHEAARQIGDLPMALREALGSVDAFRDIGGTAGGLARRAAFELKVASEGHSDTMIRAEVDREFSRALERYDAALIDEVARTRSGFVDLVFAQRKAIARLRHELATTTTANATEK